MSKAKRFLCLVLAAVMSVSVLAACGKKVEENPQVTPDISESAPVTTPAPVTTTEPTTTPAPTTTTEPTTTPPPTQTEPETTPTPTTTEDEDSYTVEELSLTMYATDAVNVRVGPSASYDRIGGLSKNESVAVTGRASTGWYRVDYRGEVGFVSNAYLTDKVPSSTQPADDEDGDVVLDEDGDVVLDEGGSNTGSSGNISINYGSWASDSGWDYMLSLMKSQGYADAVNAIAQGLANHETDIYIDSSYIPRDEVDDFMNLITPLIAVEYCYVERIPSYNVSAYNQGIISLSVDYYTSSSAEDARMMEELRSAADSILSGVRSSWSDYDKILYIHDRFIEGCDSSSDNYAGRNDLWVASAYGSIVDGRATCLGYAKGLFYLLSRAGFDTVMCVGSGLGYDASAKHVWVKVKADGRWYNIDPTWDDKPGQTAVASNLVGYEFFMVTDQFMHETHCQVFDMQFFNVPSATSETLNWYKVNGYYAESLSEAERMVEKATEEAVARGGDYEMFSIRFATVELYEEYNANYTRSIYNASILPNYSSRYTCDKKFMGTNSGYDVHTRTITMRLAK